jgi:hypothetical protein
VKALCEDQALRSSVLASMPTLDEGGLAVRQLGVIPTASSRSLVPRQTASNILATVPGGRDLEVRPPAGKGKRRRRCQSTGRRATPGLPRQKDAARPRSQLRPGAANPKGANPGGSSEAMAPWSGSQRPSARRPRERRSRAGLHLLHRNTGLPRDNRLLRLHHQNGGKRHHHHRPRSGHSPRRRRPKLRRARTPTKGPGGP